MEKVDMRELTRLLNDTVDSWVVRAGVEKGNAILGVGTCLMLMRLSLRRSKADILSELRAREAAGGPLLTFRERLGIKLDWTEHLDRLGAIGIDVENWYYQLENRLGVWAKARGFEKGPVVEAAADCLKEMELSLQRQSPRRTSILDQPGTYHWWGVIKPFGGVNQ